MTLSELCEDFRCTPEECARLMAFLGMYRLEKLIRQDAVEAAEGTP